MTLKKKKIRLVLSGAAVFITAFALWLIWGNTALQLNAYTMTSDKIPEEFYGCRIAHISDLHNSEIGENNEKLISMLSQAEPDIIAITGDLFDSRNTDIETAVSFVKEAMEIAPCYYVTGNHEARMPQYDELKRCLIELDVFVLDNKRIELEKNGKSITLVGLADPSYEAYRMYIDEQSVAEMHLQELLAEKNGYTVLLSHRPELFELYSESGADLILSGHAHGGQIRLPAVGGVFAPNQGFFPKYDSGLYTAGTVNMIVSRGIGNSAFPMRVNNRPEIILIELQGDIF